MEALIVLSVLFIALFLAIVHLAYWMDVWFGK